MTKPKSREILDKNLNSQSRWEGAMRDALALAARSTDKGRVRCLKLAAEVFRDNAERGESWPGTHADSGHYLMADVESELVLKGFGLAGEGLWTEASTACVLESQEVDDWLCIRLSIPLPIDSDEAGRVAKDLERHIKARMKL